MVPPLGPTYVGQVASVAGGIVRVRLRDDMLSTLVMIQGESYRVGQIGGFFRIPLGYAQLYAVCTQIGADAAPHTDAPPLADMVLEEDNSQTLSGYRWMTVVLFGEAVGGEFERGVGQYPTVGDEVHIVTNDDLKTIYGWASGTTGTITVGRVAATAGIPADLNVAGLVSRHCAVVGSTGAGKSNLVTVLLEAATDGKFPNARAIVIDPHGEYASALADRARVFRITPDEKMGEKPLWVPFWALPFTELRHLILADLQPAHEAAIRDEVLKMKTAAAQQLSVAPPIEALTADSPIPFSIKQLWYQLDRFERITFCKSGTNQNEDTANSPEEDGDPSLLKSAKYPPASPYNQAPYQNQRKRNIERQLDLMASRLRDGRYKFLFSPGDGLEPALDGGIGADLDALVSDWVGHDKPVTVFDVSALPSEVLPTIVGTMLRVIHDMLFWGQDLPIGGRHQPLLIVIDEAHLFVPEGAESPAHRTLSTLAKEGRKYGVGLMLVSQRPSELDSSVLSQCGSLIAMRLTNASDRAKVAATVPDDLGGLVELLPSLRTGEGVFMGEIMPIPTRVRVRKASDKPFGDDPRLPEVWQTVPRPDADLYTTALSNWRAQSDAAGETSPTTGKEEHRDA